MRLANELATLAMEHVRDEIRPGMRESEVGAMFEGHVHAHRHGLPGPGGAGARVHAGLVRRRASARSPRPANRPVAADEPTLLEIWVCADGYWSDLTKNACPGTLRPDYDDAARRPARRLRRGGRPRAPRREPRRARHADPRRHRRRSATPASRATRSATASARARTSRRSRTARCRRRSRRAWCSRSSRRSTGRAAAGCGWRTTSSSPQTAASGSRATPTTFAWRSRA